VRRSEIDSPAAVCVEVNLDMRGGWAAAFDRRRQGVLDVRVHGHSGPTFSKWYSKENIFYIQSLSIQTFFCLGWNYE
jgi:hypothetical protein